MGLLNGVSNTDYYHGNDFGNYQFVSLTDIINQFMLIYVGEDKIIPKAKRLDVAFHAQRALAELSFDTFKSFKAEEFDVPGSLQMPLPQDYVNYTRILWVDDAGIKHPLYPTKHTQNPKTFYQNSDGEYKINPVGTLTLNSNVVTLDGDYSGILVHGMRVIAPNLPDASYIHNITLSSFGKTEITLKNKNGTADKNADLTNKQQLRITRFNYLGEGRRLYGQSLIETTVSAAAVIGDTLLKLDSITGIEVGMFINHPSFVNNNDVDGGNGAIKVVGVGTNSVQLSHPAAFDVDNGDAVGFVTNDDSSRTWNNYKSSSPAENKSVGSYEDDRYWPADGERYGIDPTFAQVNGSYFIDNIRGLIHFSSNLSGRTVVLDYISDSLGTDEEMQVHKFAEEAMYKWISHAILSGKANVPEYQVNRLRKERFAAVRTAKLRLSNLKIEELTQILRGKSKWIKH